jgi:hypothetical protein
MRVLTGVVFYREYPDRMYVLIRISFMETESAMMECLC